MLDNKIPDRTPYKISVSVQLDSTADQFRNIRYILSQPHIELGIQTGDLGLINRRILSKLTRNQFWQ